MFTPWYNLSINQGSTPRSDQNLVYLSAYTYGAGENTPRALREHSWYTRGTLQDPTNTFVLRGEYSGALQSTLVPGSTLCAPRDTGGILSNRNSRYTYVHLGYKHTHLGALWCTLGTLRVA